MAAGIVVVEEDASPKPSFNSSSCSKWGSGSISSYVGLSFAVFLGFLPRYSISLVSSLQCRNRDLSLKLIQAEEQLRQMKTRRKEDSKANARVVEIFASHRNGWQQEEKRLLVQIEASSQEIAHLRAKIEHLEQSEAQLRICVDRLHTQVNEREEMINFMSRRPPSSTTGSPDQNFFVGDDEYDHEEDFSFEKLQVKKESAVMVCGTAPAASASGFYATSSQISRASYESYTSRCVPVPLPFLAPIEGNGKFSTTTSSSRRTFDNKIRVSEDLDPVSEEECLYSEEADENGGGAGPTFSLRQQGRQTDLCSSEDFPPSASKVWVDRSTTKYWQDVQCASLESSYQTKHFVARRESRWNVDGKSSGLPSKLKLLEQELLNLEKIDKGELSKIPSLLRKQAKRYQTLAGKIDDLCRKMEQQQQQRTGCEEEEEEEEESNNSSSSSRESFLIEAYHLQQRAVETGEKLTTLQNDITRVETTTTRRCLDSIKTKLREIQRNLEVWLARIMGDLEGAILANTSTSTDGGERRDDYYYCYMSSSGLADQHYL